MTTDQHDDLIERLRAADPADGLEPRPASREALTAARRRRSGHRATAGVLASAGAALFIALAPFSGGSVGAGSLAGSGGFPGFPVPVPVLANAAEAAELPPDSIMVTTSTVTVRTNLGRLDQRRTTWLRVSGGGEVIAHRTRNLKPSGDVMSDEFSEGTHEGGDAVLTSLDPQTGKVETHQGTRSVASTLFLDAKALLRRAEDDGKVVPATVDGREAYRIVVTKEAEAPFEPLPGDRSELLVDAETFLPLVLHKHSEGDDVNGDPYTYDYRERVLGRETLPDTPENRALLRVGT